MRKLPTKLGFPVLHRPAENLLVPARWLDGPSFLQAVGWKSSFKTRPRVRMTLPCHRACTPVLSSPSLRKKAQIPEGLGPLRDPKASEESPGSGNLAPQEPTLLQG